MKSFPNIFRPGQRIDGLGTWSPFEFAVQPDETPASCPVEKAVQASRQPAIEASRLPSIPVVPSKPQAIETMLASGIHLIKASSVNGFIGGWEPQEFNRFPTAFQPAHEVLSQTKESPENLEMQVRASIEAEMMAEIQATLEAAETQAQEMRQQAQQEADQLLAQARRQADEILLQAQESAEDVTNQARLQGLEAGRVEVSQILGIAQTIVNEVARWRDALLSQSEPMVVGLVQGMATKMFSEGLALDPETLGKTFQKAMAEAKPLGDLRIRAHPEDIAALGPLWPGQQTSMSGQKIEMVPDVDIQRGGCSIEGQYGSVDARVKTQLHLIKETLDEALVASTRVSDPFTTYDTTAGNSGQ